MRNSVQIWKLLFQLCKTTNCIYQADFGVRQKRGETLSWMSERLEGHQERQAGHHSPTHALALPTVGSQDYLGCFGHALGPLGAQFE